MLRGSENEPDGGDRNGGGKGLGVRFAKSAKPVSKRKGSFGIESGSGSGVVTLPDVSVAVVAVVEERLPDAVCWGHRRHCVRRTEDINLRVRPVLEASRNEGCDLLMPTNEV